MKVNPRASYHMEDWGLRPVREPDDWLKLEVLDPEQGVLGEHLQALESDVLARIHRSDGPWR